MITKYKKGLHQSSEYLAEYKVKSGIIISSKSFLANNDGEIFETNRIEFEIIPKTISWAYFN